MTEVIYQNVEETQYIPNEEI